MCKDVFLIVEKVCEKLREKLFKHVKCRLKIRNW